MANIQRGEAAGQRILQVLDTKIEVADHPNSISIDSFEHSVEFRDVCFTGVYNARAKIIRIAFIDFVRKSELLVLYKIRNIFQ